MPRLSLHRSVRRDACGIEMAQRVQGPSNRGVTPRRGWRVWGREWMPCSIARIPPPRPVAEIREVARRLPGRGSGMAVKRAATRSPTETPASEHLRASRSLTGWPITRALVVRAQSDLLLIVAQEEPQIPRTNPTAVEFHLVTRRAIGADCPSSAQHPTLVGDPIMSRTTKLSRSLWLAIPIVIAVCEQAEAGKPPAPAPSAPVAYRAVWFEEVAAPPEVTAVLGTGSALNDINDSLSAVGSAHWYDGQQWHLRAAIAVVKYTQAGVPYLESHRLDEFTQPLPAGQYLERSFSHQQCGNRGRASGRGRPFWRFCM